MADRFRPLQDFDDLDATDTRLRAAFEAEASDSGRAEVLTQRARVQGLRGDFAAGDRLLDDAVGLAGDAGVVKVRVALERGRLRRSAGDPAAALPLFESAYATACTAGLWCLAADAAHMAALAAPDRDALIAWTHRGLGLGEEHEDAAYWAGPLLNNLGWELLATDPEQALDAFERALAARERDPDDPAAIAIARYAVGRALRAVGRAGEAIVEVERAVAWADGAGSPDGWFHEELAEDYAAVGRLDEAAVHARLAMPLLASSDSSYATDALRPARLRELASYG